MRPSDELIKEPSKMEVTGDEATTSAYVPHLFLVEDAVVIFILKLK